MATASAAATRVDARRNRELIIAAGRRVFGGEAFDVPLARVLEEAGVGRGTFYRNFRDRHELAHHIFESDVEALEIFAAQNSDDALLFERLLEFALRQIETYPGIAALHEELDAGFVDDMARRTRIVFLEPTRDAARDSTRLGSGIDVDDVIVAIRMVASTVAAANSPAARHEVMLRCRRVIATGLMG